MDHHLLQVVALLTLIAFGGTSWSIEACSPIDLEALMSFKNGIQKDTSGRLAKWIGASCCKWEGIVCENATFRVIQINLPGLISTDTDLSQTQMIGRISPSITLLSSLEIIDLGGLVGLSGAIPDTIGLHLPKLQKLYLYGNNLTGPIPESIGKFPNLQELALQENKLWGSIPMSLGSLQGLKRLLLYSNKLSGIIPDSLGNLINLTELDAHDNALVGNIPNSVGEMKALTKLDLSNNFLSGKMPSSLTNLTAISVLYLNTNSLEGTIAFPSRSGEMSSLGFLRLHNNLLGGNIPSNIGYLVSLQRLSLSNNKLEGALPSSLGNLVSLTELYLSGNFLSDQIPKSLGQLSRLIMLNISRNLIEGPLPQEISSLQNLQTLDLSFNHLQLSAIPKWMANMSSLSNVYLAGCGIQGQIPDFFQTTNSPIQELDLSVNILSGSIPSWIGSLSQLYLLNLSGNSLYSDIPDSFRNLQDLGVLDLHSNRLTGSIAPVFEIEQGIFGGSLKFVDLSENSFSSGIEEIGGGQLSIQFLNLSHNHLEGRLHIPEVLANLTSLKILKLQENLFTGKIPNGFLKLLKLKELNVSNNHLEGEIPEGKPLVDFPESSYSGNKGLCGKPLGPCKL
ncbi:LRR receptor-like serine/threonine-protein kinase FLS2 [Vigna unguiculata]|uniref:LRR receptor-like serine/threonine-protein kinase FLS2 n=1 Tax=Vigna unguiculata TaxID=3917 RepID=A0A4D6L2B2_VIGUN|nr:LRR receptor-like serine/threonine-protein kinase FLS2 [Vigna unguiculata]